MQMLFLFYTQAEGGAPGYLSRKGEEAAQNLTQSLLQFLTESLQIDLASEFDTRAHSINEDIQWKAFRKPESLTGAVHAALRLMTDVLMIAGGEERTLKTTVPLASEFALPVCVDERLDKTKKDKRAKGTLLDGLTELLTVHLSTAPKIPKVVLVGTSLAALEEWLQNEVEPEKFSAMKEVFAKSSEADSLPVVFIAGAENDKDSIRWVMD